MPTKAGFYQKRVVLFDATSANSSTFTSSSHYVGDYRQMSVTLDSFPAASRLTVQGSNDDGFRSSINTWSVVTTITSAGIYTVDPGFRWMRGLRSSINSLIAVTLEGRT